jgi:hypothetical protein
MMSKLYHLTNTNILTLQKHTSTTSSIEIFQNFNSLYKILNLNEPPLKTP